MKTLTRISALLLVMLMMSCSNEQSLQEYYVDSQENSNFLSLDLPTSLIMTSQDNMTAEQKETVESIKKVNLLAFQKKDDNTAEYEAEKAKISKILSNDKFQVLMKFNQNGMNAKVMYLGEDDAIDEIIMYGESYEQGFGLARVLGKNMKPENLIKFMENMDKDMINLEGFEDFAKSMDKQS